MKCYILYHDDAPVSVASIMDNNGAASLEFVGTVPEMRRRGFAKAVCEKAGSYGRAFYSEVTPNERYRLLKKYDTPRDYTHYKSAEESQKDCVDIVMLSKKLKQLCRTYDLPYFDSSYDRERVFATILPDAGLLR